MWPRYRRLPRRLDYGADPYIFHTSKDNYCREYFEVLDFKRRGIKKFDQKSLALPTAVEQLLHDALQDSNEIAFSIPDVLVSKCILWRY